jgi:peptidoglycan/LPS O-acetylase OafA/YrhL
MLPVTRMLSISVGAWLAVREFEGKPFRGVICALMTVAAILVLGLMRLGRGEGLIASQGLYWTIALACYALLSLSFCSTVIFDTGRFAGWLRAALCLAPLRGLGRISYGLYLYHLPVLFYLGLNDATVADGAVPLAKLGLASAIILALGIASYFAIEQPLLSLRKSRAPSPAKPSSVLGG